MNHVDQQRPSRGALRATPVGVATPGLRQRPPANAEGADSDALFVSAKTLARQWDCSHTTVCRSLEQAGVPAFFLGKGRDGAKRYRKADVDAFLQSIEHC
jgi:hypothetical protein